MTLQPTHVEGAEPTSLRTNFSWTFLGNGIYNACQWGIVVVLAKLGSPELVGRYSLALAVTTPAFMFTNMSLSAVLSGDAANQHEFGEYLGLRLVLSALCIIPVLLAVWLTGYRRELAIVVALVALAKFMESISDVTFGLMQKHERMDLVARSMIMKGVFSLAALATVLWLTGSLAFAVGALCVVWTVLLLAYDVPNARTWGAVWPSFGSSALRGLLWMSLPLGVVGALNSLSGQIPRYAMDHFYGERELGIYSAVAVLGMLTSMVAVALSRSALPRLSRHYAAGRIGEFKALVLRLIGMGSAVCAVGVLAAWAFGRQFLGLVYTSEYADRADVLVVVVLGTGLFTTFSFLGTAATAARQFRPQVVAHVLKVLTVCASSLVLVPRWGSLGAAWTLVAGVCVSSVVYMVIVATAVRESRTRSPAAAR